MCHAVAAAAPAVHCNGIQPYRGAAWEEGRLLLLSSRGVINYLSSASIHPPSTGAQELRNPVQFRKLNCATKNILIRPYTNTI